MQFKKSGLKISRYYKQFNKILERQQLKKIYSYEKIIN